MAKVLKVSLAPIAAIALTSVLGLPVHSLGLAKAAAERICVASTGPNGEVTSYCYNTTSDPGPVTPGNQGNQGSSNTANQKPCRYVKEDKASFIEDGSFPLPGTRTDYENWNIWAHECNDGAGGEYFVDDYVWRLITNPPVVPGPTYGAMAATARGLIPWIAPTIGMAPDGRQVVNVPSWIWATGASRGVLEGGHAYIAAYNFDIWAVAVPYRMDFRGTPGSPITSCEGLGSPGSPSCSYTYGESASSAGGSCVGSAARIAYRIDYFGFDYNSTFLVGGFAPISVGVDEIQSVNVGKSNGANVAVPAGLCQIG